MKKNSQGYAPPEVVAILREKMETLHQTDTALFWKTFKGLGANIYLKDLKEGHIRLNKVSTICDRLGLKLDVSIRVNGCGRCKHFVKFGIKMPEGIDLAEIKGRCMAVKSPHMGCYVSAKDYCQFFCEK